MAKYDVYPNPSGDGFLLDIQTDLLSGLNTRVVVPLLPKSRAPQPANRLNPVFLIEGQEVVMVTQFLAAVPLSALKAPVGHLGDAFETITNALDLLMSGF